MAARTPTCSLTERPVSMEAPRSPCSRFAHQSRYCTASGRSSPSSARSWATRSGGEFTPAITAATSPGRMRSMANTTTEMASNATTNSSSRRSTNLIGHSLSYARFHKGNWVWLRFTGKPCTPLTQAVVMR